VTHQLHRVFQIERAIIEIFLLVDNLTYRCFYLEFTNGLQSFTINFHFFWNLRFAITWILFCEVCVTLV